MKVRYKKKVARPGTVMPKNPFGTRRVKVIDKDYLASVAETGNEMLKEGILIPCPYGHTDDNGVYPIPLLKGINGSLVDAKSGDPSRWDHAINSGFVTGFEIDPTDGGLVVESEHEGTPEDQETHAGRVGTTFKQTSPFISDWTDGTGRHWKNAPLHVCLTNRGVQHAQEEFQLVTPAGVPNQEMIAKQGLTSPELAIAMSLDSDSYTDNALAEALALSADDDLASLNKAVQSPLGLTPEIVSKIKEQLKTKLGLTLPDDTDINNVGDRLLTILTNMEPRKEGDDIATMPTGSDVIQAPLIMSTDAQVPNQEVNPDDLVIANKRSSFLLSEYVNAKKKTLVSRINRMIRSGQIGRPKGEKYLTQVNSLALSLDDFDGETAPMTPLELALDMAEETDSLVDGDPNGQDAPEDGYVPNSAADMEDGEEKQLTDDEVRAMYDEALGVKG